jgi:ABC-type bacteriocin/lantibiotic exporter with double-glycine peptidase domain
MQVLLVFLVILVVFARVIPLEMQKRIINESIALRQYDNLFLYCGIYLTAIVSANFLKFAINCLQTFIGERAMSAMRKALYSHIITLPLSFFRKTQPGFVVSSLITELSTIGTFSGMAIAVPLTNILTLIAFAGYLIWLNPKLALSTLAIYPIAIFVLPLLQNKANKANKRRVDLSRKTSSKIAESISGINEIHAHGSFLEENHAFGFLIDRLQKIRIRWSLLRHGIKTTNNFFVSLGPFIVFILGGYLTIEGKLELGALVAFLSAQEKLYDPWQELIAFYQLYQDSRVRYRKTTDHFNVDSEIDLSSRDENLPNLQGALIVSDLSYQTNDGHLILKDISFTLGKGEHLALVGFSGSGKSTLARCIGNLLSYSEGSIRLDNIELSSLNKTYIVHNIGFVSQHPFIFTGTVEDNLLYAHNAKYPLENRPVPSLDDKIEALQNAALFVDVLRFGLDTRPLAKNVDFKEKVLKMRKNFQQNCKEDLSELLKFYPLPSDSVSDYLDDQPIINNIFFGEIVSTKSEDQERINHTVVQLLIEEDCLEMVAQLGLHYHVGSEGVKLSGGQRQKLAIARVILKKPNFLIFDEATSALDNKSQTRIERMRVMKWRGKLTVIAVVHRLDAINSYDKIAVMQDGRIVEFGSYDDLMNQGEFLRRLISKKSH